MPRTLLRAPAMAAVIALACNAGAAAPPNDQCGSGGPAYVIPAAGGMLAGDLTEATRDTIDVACVGALGGVDVYYTLTPATSGMYVINTCGAAFDTVLSLHTACPTSAMNTVAGACNDDGCGLQSQLTISLPAGQSYVLRVASYDGSTIPGPFVLTVQFTPAPANDVCSLSVPTLALDTPVTSSNAGASSDITVTPSSLCGTFVGSGGGADVWYRFTPTNTGAYTLSTCGSTIDTVLSIHAACPTSANDLITCNDDAGAVLCPANRLASTLTTALVGGRTYLVRVAGYRAGSATGVPATGTFTLTAMTSAEPFGACCDFSNVCQVTLATQCSGTFLGNSTVCHPASCATGLGVCCIGAVCLITTSGDCAPPNGDTAGASFTGAATCNEPGNQTTPCCHSDFDKDGLTGVLDIFAYLNAWFAGSPYAAVEGDGMRSPGVQDIFTYLNLWFAGGC